MSVQSVIYGLEGLRLTKDEKAFFRDSDPWAFNLFARNVDSPKQVMGLNDELRDCLGRECFIFIDQEGGRVQRLRPPHWRKAPPANVFTALWNREPELALLAVKLNHQLIGAELRGLGIDADFAPVVDLSIPGADDVIGDRAYHTDPAAIGAMARAALEGLNAQGVAGVIKHIPGHGRADADSHHALPIVREEADLLMETDFAAFKAIKDAPMAMTAHVVYAAYDDEHPATVSTAVIDSVIRGAIGFDGLLMSDDVSMKALAGTLQQRAERSLKAGCDLVLHCNGLMGEMVEVAHGLKALDGKALERANSAEATRGPAKALNIEASLETLEGYFKEAGLELETA